ncbi:MAG: twitching motility protein PilT [Candidatus Aenigmarchaeota archaeon]|nr:twitching motility protein PilT [Candidatus Aenigmarchaeota archaeon]
MTKIVVDTSIIIDGKVPKVIEELGVKEVIVPYVVLDELQAQASKGREEGFIGLENLKEIRRVCEEKGIKLRFTGERPSLEDIKLAKSGRLDAIIRDIAKDEDAILVTADYVQALVGEAEGVKTHYVPGEVKQKGLKFEQFFTPDTMSVHLKEGVPPLAKRGKPGKLQLVRIRDEPCTEEELNEIIREIFDLARVSKDAFIEINKSHATVIQLGEYRIAIARPPFSDGLEVTIVRPLVKLKLEDYNLSEKLIKRLKEKAEGVLVCGPPGSGKCVDMSLPIILENGTGIDINKLTLRANVLSLTPYGILQTPVKRKWIRKEKTLVELVTSTGRVLRVSKDHPILTVKDGRVEWKRAENVGIDDRIAVVRKIKISSDDEYVRLPVENLKCNQVYVKVDDEFLPLSEVFDRIKDVECVEAFYFGKNRRKSRTITIPLFLSEDLAELMGFVWSEGSGSKFEFTNKNPVLVKRFKELLRTVFGIDEKDVIEIEPHRYYVRRSKILHQFFVKVLGMPTRKKSKSLKVPDFLMKSNDRVVARFIRSFFDGDGCITKRGIEISTASKTLAEQLSFLLLRFGIISILKKRKDSENYRILISGKENVRKFYERIGTLIHDDKFKEYLKGGSHTNVDLIPASSLVVRLHKLLNLPYDSYHFSKNLFSRKRLEKVFDRLLKRYAEFYALTKDVERLEMMWKTLEKWEEIVKDIRKELGKNERNFLISNRLDHQSLKLWTEKKREPTLQTFVKLFTAFSKYNQKMEVEAIRFQFVEKYWKVVYSRVLERCFRNVKEVVEQKRDREVLRALLNSSIKTTKIDRLKFFIQSLVEKFRDKSDEIEFLLTQLIILLNDFVLWDRVKEKRILKGDFKVFDIEVAKSHNFLVGYPPVIVHNSTFVSSLADFYSSLGKVVKTLESPRDLQVGPEITQYAPLEGDYAKTADILLLVRPDYTVFDEVRKTKEFEVFTDLRLAGVGMVGVVHASDAIDAIQRFIGRIELG